MSPESPIASKDVVKEIISLLDAQEDDEIFELSSGVATQPRQPTVQAFRNPRTQDSDRLVSRSTLRATASDFIPSGHPNAHPIASKPGYTSEEKLFGVGRIRKSGTIRPTSISPAVDFDLLSSGSSTPSRASSRLSITSDDSEDSQDSDGDFLLDVLARRVRKSEQTHRSKVVSPVSPALRSRQDSVPSRPNRYIASFETKTNESFYVSRTVRSPVLGKDGVDIPISSEEDISRLFDFDFRPSLPQEDILVDIVSRSKDGSEPRERLEVDEYTEEEPQDLEAKEEKRIVLVDKDKDKGATRVSVQPVDSGSSFLNVSAPIFIPRQRPQASHPAGETSLEENRILEGLLVDLTEPTPNPMKRMSQSQIRSGIALAQRISRPSSGINGEGDLIDLGQPVASSSTSRGRNDNRDTRQRMKARTPTSGRSSRSSSPVRATESIRNQYAKISPYSQLLSRKSPRLTVSPHLMDRNGSDPLQRSLISAWKNTEPSQQKKQDVSDLLERLSVALNQYLGDRISTAKGKRRFEVDVFGSVSWGGETGESGDLDLIVLDHRLPQGYHPSLWRTPPGEVVVSSRAPVAPLYQVPPVYIMRRIQRVLEAMDMRDCQSIISATTPIVKFTEPTTRLECDICVNDLGGWYNSSLILHYCLIAPYILRPMIHGLKLWAKAFNLNDPSGAKGAATMSSYCLTLMAIAYLQYRGVLPNLQANVRAVLPEDPAREDPDSIWVGFGREQGIKAHIGFDRKPPPGWKSKEPSLTAAEALRGFFSFFNGSSGEFKFDKQLISILQGGIVPRAKEKGWSKRTEAKIRNDLISQGAALEQIREAIRDHQRQLHESEKNIGKGDKGIQHSAWEERLIVVQDPFLWQKNCAASMSGDGTVRFQKALAHTATQLQSKDVEFEDILHDPNPVPSRTSTPRRGGFGHGGRGRGAPSPIPRPDSVGSTGSRGSGGGRGRGRGRGRGGGISWNNQEGRFVV